MATPIKNRYDFIFLFDVKDGNPNGDPDQANLPRVDAENQEGLVTDVCIKRKVRNYVELKSGGKPGNSIFVRQGNVLNTIIEKAKGKNPKERQTSLCDDYWDIRTFGAVLSTGDSAKNAGTVRGPVQFTFARSQDRIFQAEHSITRQAVATEEEAKKQQSREFASTIGRKATVPYGLYRMHGFVSAVDAVKTGFSQEDLDLLWDALLNAFELDRSAARGEMNPRKLIVFRHESHLGNARAGELFERVTIEKKNSLPRSWADYEVLTRRDNLPKGVELQEKL
ncbi:MAG: type I-C CRISPR-associated protein Cas7/Csd2 [Bacteroidota bacterium]